MFILQKKSLKFSVLVFSIFLISCFLGAEAQKFKVGETKTYSIRKEGRDAGFCKFKVEKKEKNFWHIEGETYFELEKDKIKHYKEKLVLSSNLSPISYSLEILSDPKPIKSIEAKVLEEKIFLTYTFKSGENIIKDEKSIPLPVGNLAILDADVIEHIVILFKKYDFATAQKQELFGFNARYGNIGKLTLIYNGRKLLKIGERQYNCHNVSVQMEGQNILEGWIEVKSGDILKVGDPNGILEIIIKQ